MNRLLLLLIFLFFTGCASAQQYTGKVVAISDGDTFTLLTSDKQQIKVRLAEIDTPERAQPYGTRARQALSDLIFSKAVRVIEADTDRYGRLVGHVYVDDIHVNRRMVQGGMAWVYRQYLEDKTLLEDEQKARKDKKGLWGLPNTEQVPPWEWRRGVKTNRKPDAVEQKRSNRNLRAAPKQNAPKW